MRVLLMGYYGSRNLGDEMMFHCLNRWLNTQGIDVTLFCENAEETSRRLQVAAVENVPLLFEWAWRDVWFRGKAFQLIKQMRRADALIVGGGDLIRDDRGWRVFMYTMEKVVLALGLGKPVMLLNVGIGRPSTWYGKRLLSWCLRRCRQVVVRDTRSMEVCKDAGINSALMPDIVTHLPDWLMPRSKGMGSADSVPYIALCLRASANAFGQYVLDENRIDNLADALSEVASRHGLKLVFLPFQSSAGENEDDNDIHAKIAARIDESLIGGIREWTNDVQQVVQCIGGASCVIAMRLHAAILAVACERPCVVMPYDYKVKEAARMFGIRGEITSEVLLERAAIVKHLENALDSAKYDPESRTIKFRSWNSLDLYGRKLQ